jgi:hypothetical protein
VVLTAVVIGSGLAWQFRGGGSGKALSDPAARDSSRSPQLEMPSAGREEASQPLQTPATVAVPSPSYAVFDKNPDGQPVAYDPCRPIHYVVRPDGAPEDGAALLLAAVNRVSQGTGLQFVNDGASDEEPRPKRQPYQPDRYGNRWAPVLIAWQSAQDNPDLASDIAGEAGSVMIGTAGRPSVYVSGQVVLDGAQIAQILTHPGGQAEVRGILLHELGHVVGLDHVQDPSQIMYPTSQAGVDDYAAGDLTGLAALGQGPCAPWL